MSISNKWSKRIDYSINDFRQLDDPLKKVKSVFDMQQLNNFQKYLRFKHLKNETMSVLKESMNAFKILE